MADMNGNDRKVVNNDDDHNNSNNNNNHHEKVEKDKNGDKDVVKNDDGDEERPDTDMNNNSVMQDNRQVPDGAVGLPEEDVEMSGVGCSRVLANQVARAVETMLDDSRAWFRLWLPDGEPGIVALGLHTTVREVNTRLANNFGQGVYFLGYRLVTGLTISAALDLTLSQLDAMGLDLGIGTMAEDWFGESRGE